MTSSGWQVLQESPPIAPHVLREILDGGQSFRWNRDEAGVWTGIWDHNVVRLRLDGGQRLLWSTPQQQPDCLHRLSDYLALDGDQDAMSDALPWRSDPVLQTARKAFPGLRILRQPVAETLLCFLCSSTKQIVQIKQICELLATRFGNRLPGGVHALPGWQQLAQVPEAELRACKMGYRARFVKQTAEALAADPGLLPSLPELPYGEAKARLLSLPGVGSKIADCVLLFGAGHLEAFPVDVWIQKVMVRLYRLDGWSPQHVEHFARLHFGPAAGLAQQYLFAYARHSIGRTGKPEETSR